jgi:hypothetical protein
MNVGIPKTLDPRRIMSEERKEPPRRAAAKARRSERGPAEPTGPIATEETDDLTPETEVMESESNTRVRVGAIAGILTVIIALVAAVIIASGGDSTEVKTVTEPAPADASTVTVSDESSSGFDMAKCLRTEVKVPNGKNGEKTVKKSKEFCEAQDALYGRTVGDDLEHTTFQSHHAKDGTVVFRGWIGKTPTEQLQSLYHWSLEDPVVAAMALGCYSHDTYDAQVLADYRQAKPGSGEHQMAVRAIYAILTNPETSFNNFLLYGKTWNEGVTESGTMTQSPGAFDGEASTQVSLPPMVLPDGQAIPGGKSTQLHRCLNCQRQSTVPGAVTTPEPGVIPPGGGEEHPGPEPEEPGIEIPGGSEETPGSPQIPSHHEPPPKEQPKTDTPDNDGGPSGTGKYQPPSETEPSSDPGSPSSNTPPPAGTTSPHPAPPEGTSPPPGGQAPEATNGGETGCPSCAY